jgi:hypothetical protein
MSRSRDSAVGIATDKSKIFKFSTVFRPLLGPTQPPTQYVKGKAVPAKDSEGP